MSKVTIRICDIENCRKEATDTLDVMLVCRQYNGDGSYTIFTERNVDLCGKHELEYRRALPDLRIKRKANYGS